MIHTYIRTYINHNNRYTHTLPLLFLLFLASFRRSRSEADAGSARRRSSNNTADDRNPARARA